MAELTQTISGANVGAAVAGERGERLPVPTARRRQLFVGAAVLVGAAAGAIYGYGVALGHGRLLAAAIAGIGCGAAGFLLAYAPRLLLHVAKRQWYRFLLHHFGGTRDERLTRARGRLQRELKEHPDAPDARRELATVHLLAGDFVAAGQQLAGLVGLSGAAGTAVHSNLAVVRTETGRPDEAFGLLYQALQGAPGDAEVEHNLGLLLAHHAPLLVRVLECTEACHVSHAVCLNNAGVRLIERGEVAHAAELLVRALEADASYAEAKANLAMTYYWRGDTRAALDALAAAAHLDPSNARILNNLGATLAAAGHVERGGIELLRADQLDPRSAAVHNNLGCAHQTLGRTAEARSRLMRAADANRAYASPWHNLGLLHWETGERDRAMEASERALERQAGDFELLSQRAWYAWKLGRHQEAADYYRRAAAAAPRQPELERSYAVCLLAEDQVQEATTRLEALQARNPEDRHLAFDLGAARLRLTLEGYRDDLGRDERQAFFTRLHQCTLIFERLAREDPATRADAMTNIGLTRFVRQEYEAAVEQFEAGMREGEGRDDLHFHIGTTLAFQAEAVQRQHEAEAGAGALVPPARELLKGARRHLERATHAQAVGADALFNLGVVCDQLGDREAAIGAFAKAISHEDSEHTHNALALVHGRAAQGLQREMQISTMMGDRKKDELRHEVRQHLSRAIHHFGQALRHSYRDPALHGNMGLTCMLRNEDGDIERTLRHWELMRQYGGFEGQKRYDYLSALMESKSGARAEFDASLYALRPLPVKRLVATVPPFSSGPRYVFEVVCDTPPWAIKTDRPEVRAVLDMDHRLAELQHKVARLLI